LRRSTSIVKSQNINTVPTLRHDNAYEVAPSIFPETAAEQKTTAHSTRDFSELFWNTSSAKSVKIRNRFLTQILTPLTDTHEPSATMRPDRNDSPRPQPHNRPTTASDPSANQSSAKSARPGSNQLPHLGGPHPRIRNPIPSEQARSVVGKRSAHLGQPRRAPPPPAAAPPAPAIPLAPPPREVFFCPPLLFVRRERERDGLRFLGRPYETEGSWCGGLVGQYGWPGGNMPLRCGARDVSEVIWAGWPQPRFLGAHRAAGRVGSR